MTKWIAVGMVLLLGGCATTSSPIPEGYTDPVATIKDFCVQHSSSQTDFYYVSHVDGRAIDNSRALTIKKNRGQGLSMDPLVIERQVAARESTFRIAARSEYAAPILTLTHAVYQVIGEVKFTPEPGRKYQVKGVLGEDYSAVWIEDEESSQVAGQKVEIKGSAKLGFFEK